MKIKSYSHIGKKKVNEDFLIHLKNCLIVCDGVGGEVKGEVASKEVATSVSEALKNKSVDYENLKDAIIASHIHLNTIIKKQPELEGMATTLASISISNNKDYFIAHIGDSRVYIVRPSTMSFWHTWDHSFVANLVKTGDITRETARNHPMNNQINRAIKANINNKLATPEIKHFDDLEKEDILFICSDGISESFSDFELLSLLANQNISIEDKLSIIEVNCSQNSNDNNTAIICELESTDVSGVATQIIPWENIDSLEEKNSLDDVSIVNDPEIKKSNENKSWLIKSTIIIIAFFIGYILLFNRNEKKTTEPNNDEIEKQDIPLPKNLDSTKNKKKGEEYDKIEHLKDSTNKAETKKPDTNNNN